MTESYQPLRCFIASNKYGLYCVPQSSAHRPVAKTIISGQVWEEETIKLIENECTGGDVIHAGTYFGDFLPALSRATSQNNGIVWTFEPNPENFKCAVITCKLNELKNVKFSNSGLAERSRKAACRIVDDNGRSLGGGSEVVENESNLAQTGHIVEVELNPIDSIIPQSRKISVIHFDLEGFEKFALQGAMKTIERWKPTLILEVHPTEEGILEDLFVIGYAKTGRVHDNVVLKRK